MTPPTIPSTIDRVTVHRSGARVVRRARLPVEDGLLRLPGLPLLLVTRTLELRAVGPDGAPLPGVRVGAPRDLTGILSAGEAEESVDAELREVGLALQDHADRVKAWTWLAQHAAGLGLPESLPVDPRAPLPHPDPASWIALADLGQTRRAQARVALAALEEEGRALEARRATLQAQGRSDRPEGEAPTLTRTLELRVEGPRPAEAWLEIAYLVSGARWTPTYALRVDSAAGTATMAMSAEVAQATGEPWNGVRLSVSTVDLARDMRLPVAGEWRIGRRGPQPPTGWRPLPEDQATLFSSYDRGRAELDLLEAPPRPAPRRARAKPVAMEAPLPPPSPMPTGGAIPAPSAMPASFAAPQMARSMAPKARGGRAEMEAVDEPAPEEPPLPAGPRPGDLLDYAWLRLPDWSTPWRGRLVPVDLASDLRDIIEQRGGSMAEADRIARAIKRLRERRARLASASPPTGCDPHPDPDQPVAHAAPVRVDLPDDGRFHAVAIGAGTRPAHRLHRAVPRQGPEVFRYVELPNPMGVPLAAGPMRIWLDGAEQATGRMRAVGPASRLRLNLGVEDRLRLARNARSSERESGMISATTVLTQSISLELRSRLSGPAEVQLFERLPLAEGVADLEVSLDKGGTAPAARDQGPDGERVEGALRFDLRVEPGAEAAVSWSYSIRHPAKKEIIGGGRREP